MTLIHLLDAELAKANEIAALERAAMECGCPHCFRLSCVYRHTAAALRAAVARQIGRAA